MCVCVSSIIKCVDVSTIQRINILIYDSVETLSPDCTIFIYEMEMPYASQVEREKIGHSLGLASRIVD